MISEIIFQKQNVVGRPSDFSQSLEVLGMFWTADYYIIDLFSPFLVGAADTMPGNWNQYQFCK